MPNKPKPTALRLVQGNPGHRPINTDEPIAPPALPEPPDYLDSRARAEWVRIGSLLKDSGLISNLDDVTFGRLCQLSSRLFDAEAAMAKGGLLVYSPNGYPMPSPYLAIINATSKQLVSLCSEFGMTPSSRSKIRVDNAKPKDEFEEFLTRGKDKAPPKR